MRRESMHRFGQPGGMRAESTNQRRGAEIGRPGKHGSMAPEWRQRSGSAGGSLARVKGPDARR
jgi:hypothetical protein